MVKGSLQFGKIIHKFGAEICSKAGNLTNYLRQNMFVTQRTALFGIETKEKCPVILLKRGV